MAYSPPGSAPGGEKAILQELMANAMEVDKEAGATLALLHALLAKAGGVAPGKLLATGGSSTVTWATSGWGEGSARPYAGPPPHEQKPFIPTDGYKDPKTNAAFPLNVRKNLREMEAKWMTAQAECTAASGVDMKLFCDFEAFYNDAKMDKHKQDKFGEIVYVQYMENWAEGFVKFVKECEDNLVAFREAMTTGRIHLRIGPWDKDYAKKQKAGYVQQSWIEGALFITIHPNHITSGLYELSNPSFLSNSL